MELTVEAALADVERATRVRKMVDQDTAMAAAMQAKAIREALRAGCAVADLVKVTGLSAPRIYQIRDERR